jgi:hypothetical protein
MKSFEESFYRPLYYYLMGFWGLVRTFPAHDFKEKYLFSEPKKFSRRSMNFYAKSFS